jgi:mannose-6-phosphate isomerase-like protein (cupin superfamily)
MKELKPINLNADSFQEYGKLLDSPSFKPWSQDEASSYWGKVALLDFKNTASTGILFTYKREFTLSNFERHMKTPEILVALEGDSIMTVGKSLPDGGIDTEAFKSFIFKQGDAIAISAGTWHWAPLPMNCSKSKFLVIFAQGTEVEDMDVKILAQKLTITV